jgi:D-lactate dehydrogenase (cytochrome)
MATDACVPISRLAECIEETREEAEASGLVCPILGHVGDGNFHVTVLYDPDDPREAAAAEALTAGIARRAIRMGGTCTGEHGIGLHKLDWLEEEHGAAVGLMRTIKRALDPQGIMNPGKTIPAR